MLRARGVLDRTRARAENCRTGGQGVPFMQRLDEYGIALHGGMNPGYPASNGCVRLPMKFAEKLYGLTKVGTEVVIEG